MPVLGQASSKNGFSLAAGGNPMSSMSGLELVCRQAWNAKRLDTPRLPFVEPFVEAHAIGRPRMN